MTSVCNLVSLILSYALVTPREGRIEYRDIWAMSSFKRSVLHSQPIHPHPSSPVA